MNTQLKQRVTRTFLFPSFFLAKRWQKKLEQPPEFADTKLSAKENFPRQKSKKLLYTDRMTIYEKYGGFDFFHKCVYGLYIDMFDHPEIAYHFIGVDLVHLSKLQTQFLVRAIGGPDTYQGGDIKLVHRSMQITAFEFTEIANAFRGVFLKAGVEKNRCRRDHEFHRLSRGRYRHSKNQFHGALHASHL